MGPNIGVDQTSLNNVEVRYAGHIDSSLVCGKSDGQFSTSDRGSLRLETPNFGPVSLNGSVISHGRGFGIIKAHSAENSPSFSSISCSDITRKQGLCSIISAPLGSESSQNPIIFASDDFDDLGEIVNVCGENLRPPVLSWRLPDNPPISGLSSITNFSILGYIHEPDGNESIAWLVVNVSASESSPEDGTEVIPFGTSECPMDDSRYTFVLYGTEAPLDSSLLDSDTSLNDARQILCDNALTAVFLTGVYRPSTQWPPPRKSG